MDCILLNYFFKKKIRLLKSINFQRVFKKNCKKNTAEISILGCTNLFNHPRLGISISRKDVKHSCSRNLIKRLIRETFRLLQHKLIFMDYIVIAKKSIVSLDNKKIIIMLNNLWSYYYQ